MSVQESTRETLHRVIDGLSEGELEDLLDYLDLDSDPDELSEEGKRLVKQGEEEIARGEYVDSQELRRRFPIVASG